MRGESGLPGFYTHALVSISCLAPHHIGTFQKHILESPHLKMNMVWELKEEASAVRNTHGRKARRSRAQLLLQLRFGTRGVKCPWVWLQLLIKAQAKATYWGRGAGKSRPHRHTQVGII